MAIVQVVVLPRGKVSGVQVLSRSTFASRRTRVIGIRAARNPCVSSSTAWRTSSSGTARASTVMSKLFSPPAGMTMWLGTLMATSGGDDASADPPARPMAQFAPGRALDGGHPGIAGHVDAGIVGVPELGGLGDVLGCRDVERDAGIARPGEVDPPGAGVERRERGDAVFLHDAPAQGRRHQRGLDLAWRPAGVEVLAAARRRRPRGGSTSTCPGWPGRALPGGPPSIVAGRRGVAGQDLHDPGAVTSGLLTPSSWAGPPRELKNAIRSPWRGPAIPAVKLAVTPVCAPRKVKRAAPSVLARCTVGTQWLSVAMPWGVPGVVRS